MESENFEGEKDDKIDLVFISPAIPFHCHLEWSLISCVWGKYIS